MSKAEGLSDLMDLRQQSLLYVSPQLFPSHDDHQLSGQLYQAATRITLEGGESLIYIKLKCSTADLREKKKLRKLTSSFLSLVIFPNM